MNEKKRRLIEESMKLFAEKGFATTSIQEIAKVCGISKGAFYLHFKSKEELLLAVLNYYFELLFEKLNEIEEEKLSPREKFIKQIECQVREIHQHKEFLIMQARENAIPYNEEIEKFIFKMRKETNQFYRKRLSAIYGEKVDPYFWDLSITLQGILHAFLQLMMTDHIQINYRQFAVYVLNCADDLVEGFEKRTHQPIIPPVVMNELFQENTDDHWILTQLSIFKGEEWTEEIMVSLDVLEKEIQTGEPRSAMLRGMLANLSEEAAFQTFVDKMKEYYYLK
ncbi:AcrR family transcriptional regulator [Bacillus ectoiniformans]|uniref:TetR/AcrR family transcriptional regulator n=1 Tax=Bacillus ectoiniformans TaxID=1494429 RepID=UPI00195C815D|nr:TetR/AcrR family transcriptional regulator [Bacillus ectoiniformans]MBM7648587.1 AcrR family transcriptional regulator [Bacillus ectoiniformans]